MEVKNSSPPIITLDESGIIEETNFDNSLWLGVPEMIESNISNPRSRIGKSFSKKQSSFEMLEEDGSKSIKNQLPLTPSSATPGKECSPYKSPTVLSFDAYGNLTSSDDPDAPFSHEVPSLAEFDYILGSFEGKLKKETEVAATAIPSRNGALRKSKIKKKHNSGNSETMPLSDKDLKQAFKKDFDTTSASATSRYGRTRKQKAQDGFLFGTINFNELRKITSPSPKKNRHSSTSEGKSDSEMSALEDLHATISQSFERLSNKMAGYSSEEEFVPVKKEKRSSSTKKQKQTPPVLDSEKPKEIQTSFSKENKKKGEGVTSNNKKRKLDSPHPERRSTRSRASIGDVRHKSKEYNTLGSAHLDKDHSETSESELEENTDTLKPQIKESLDFKQVKKSLGTKKIKVEELGSIQEDVNIIKSSLAESNPVSPKSSKDLDTPSDDLDIKLMFESSVSSKSSKNNIQGSTEKAEAESTSTPLEIEPKIIEMETLNEEVKSEEPPKKRPGRPLKKTILIDISEEKQRQSLAPLEDLTDMADIDLKMKKLNPCSYFNGDLVWVTMKGNPLWPGMITYPKNETEYTRINHRGTSTQKGTGLRQYHVQFFYDNQQTMWVSANALFPYEGLIKLLSLMEQIKNIAKLVKSGGSPMSKKHDSLLNSCVGKIIMKTHLRMNTFISRDKQSHSKTHQWYKAVEEADTAQKMDRNKRLQRFRLKETHQKRKKRRSGDDDDETFFSPSTKVQKHVNKPAVNPTTKQNCSSSKYETSSVRSKSSDDFSGFDDNSSGDKSHSKRPPRMNNNLKGGDFEVYLQKYLDSTMDDLGVSKDKAKVFLKKKWKKLTPAQKSRYKSKINYDHSTSSCDTDDSSSDLSSLSSSKSKKSSGHDEDGSGESAASRGTYRVPKNEKVCHSCENATVRSGSDMVKCKGVCASVFHLSCVGLDVAPEGDFRCSDCLSGIHPCFICKSKEGKKDKCSLPSCGKFYHSECVKLWPQVSKARQLEKLVCPRHVCHMCAANADDMNDPAARTPPFTRCLRCPTAYHTGESCIAAGVEEVSQNYHICTKHIKIPKNNQNHCNVNWCFCCSKGGSLLLCDQCPAAFHAECLNIDAPEGSFICEDCENGKFPVYGDIVWVKMGCYRWWPGEVLHQRYIPDNIENLSHVQGMFCVHFFGSNDYYWMSRGRTFHYQEGDQGSKSSSSKSLEEQFKKALDEAFVAYMKQKEKRDRQELSRSMKGNLKPPPYIKIDTNKPVGNVRLGKLDPSAITRCDCDPYSENPCASDDKCINRMLMVECIREVCPAKDRCNNQRFQRRQYPNVFPFKTSGRGFGLKTKDFIKKGDFVIEYVGELIDEAEFRRRIEEMHEYKEENYYFLTVETDRLIDAGPKGNLARFMNHSCQPNCETQKWTVGADTRVGLFALEDIPEGSELTFNYNLQCVGTEKKKCNCGSPNCSGFIGAKVQKPELASLKSKKPENSVKRKKKGRKRKNEKNTENECFRCGLAGDLILCDMTLCPKGYHLNCLELKELPKGKWLCPWHHCDECGNRAAYRCIMCPNSYCKSHSKDKFNSSAELSNVCLDHGSEVEASRGRRKVNQNPGPVVNTVQKCPPESTLVVQDPTRSSDPTASSSPLLLLSRARKRTRCDTETENRAPQTAALLPPPPQRVLRKLSTTTSRTSSPSCVRKAITTATTLPVKKVLSSVTNNNDRSTVDNNSKKRL